MTKQAVSAPQPTAVGEVTPDYLKGKKMTGGGVSTSKDDILIPMARVLQPLSPEVLQGSQQIPNAVAGDIYIKNAPNPVLKGASGFLFQPCHFSTAVVEWKPRSQGGGGGGGYVARHANMPSDVVSRPHPENPDRMMQVSSRTGNVYVETRYHAGFIITDEGVPMPCYVPFSSSGHQVSRAWMLLMSLKRLGGAPVDSWAAYYKFTTKMVTKNGKSWFIFDITDGGPKKDGAATPQWAPTEDDFNRGEALYKALEAGELQLDDRDPPSDGTASPATDIPF